MKSIKMNGRAYVERPDGTLKPVFDAALHAEGLLKAIGKKHVIAGVRIVDPARPDEPAVMVNFEEGEQAAVLAAVKDVLTARVAKG